MFKTNGKDVAAAASAIDSVDVDLEAFVGTARMTVAALAELEPDEIITLDSTLSSHIDIRLNGISIAQGELVSVGDQFGVRIVSIASDLVRRG